MGDIYLIYSLIINRLIINIINSNCADWEEMERPRLCSNGFLKETFNDIESKLASQETHISDMNVANNYSGSFWDDGVKAKTGHFQKNPDLQML